MKIFTLPQAFRKSYPDLDAMILRPSEQGDVLYLFHRNDLEMQNLLRLRVADGDCQMMTVATEQRGVLYSVPDVTHDGQWMTWGLSVVSTLNRKTILNLIPQSERSPRFGYPFYERLFFSPDNQNLFGIRTQSSPDDLSQIDQWPIGKAIATKKKEVSITPVKTVSLFVEYFDRAFDVAISPNGQYLAALSSSRNHVFRWRIDTPIPYAIPKITLNGTNTNWCWTPRIQFTSDSQRLLIGGSQWALLDMASETLRVFEPTVGFSFAITPTSEFLLIANGEGVEIWSLDDLRLRSAMRFQEMIGEVQHVALSTDGLTAYAAGTEGRIICWDLD